MRHPARTSITLLTAVVIAGCGGSSSESGSGISDQAHRDYVAGCVDSGQTKAGCECLYRELTTKQGVDTEPKFKRLIQEVQAASSSGNPAAGMPPKFRNAALACKSELH
jgi:hypothetical protein